MKVLVCGGAGYVGAHTCLRLFEAGFEPVVYDNLSNGWGSSVRWGPFEDGDICDLHRLSEVFEQHRPAAVIHFAALIEVGESVLRPGAFFRTNVAGSLGLIDMAQKHGVQAFVFSSTCATYGEPARLPLDETHPQEPVNPYGRSKLMVEQALAEYDRWMGFRSVCLRYFNAAGADPEGRIGERHEPETHAIPLAIDAALGRRAGFTLFGTDYDTRDGTAVRDYVHVLDLADAHVRALRYLLDGGKSEAINLGTGTGTSVRELIRAIEAVSGKPFPVKTTERRAGDAAVLVADNKKARTVLGWEPQFNLEDIVKTAWAWHAEHLPRLNDAGR